MSIATIDNVHTILPPVKKMTFKGFGKEADEQATRWGWSALYRDVCPILRHHFSCHSEAGFRDFGLGEMMADDIFGRYGLLNAHDQGKPLFTWSTPSTVSPMLVIKGHRPVHPPIDPHFIYIPLGWVKNVLAAAEQGIVRVTSTPIEFKETVPRSGFALIGERADKTKLEAISDGCSPNGFRYVPLSAWLAGSLV